MVESNQSVETPELPAHGYQKIREQVNAAFEAVGSYFLGILAGVIKETGELVLFGLYAIKAFWRKPFRREELIQHMEFAGNKSIFIICLTGMFTGMALSFQVYLGFKMVNATSLVGPTVGLGIFRELGPVLTGLIVAARAGGAMAARLGTMRVTEQIDALEVMGVEPRQYLISPRVWACTIVMPLLTGVFDFMAMVGCYILCIRVLDMDEALFFDRTQLYLQPYHLYEGLFKAMIFGAVFSIICTHRGYNTKGGAEGVGTATNRGVVLSMVMIIILDFFLMNIIDVFYKIREAMGVMS